ncbi:MULTISPECIES: inositol monophosphatase family protein [Paenibacillus]|uniref:inositol monophosphatase family protein n=1 Tax=Paenibacillus TaxID=44249 RepID=UPI0022B8B075|nr:inositol monophosphatase family protein [Paenibacillus caseinilyticus]MCZ8520415.1 inositol monophosphatase [Paenibacillus caseinilyticus]
MIHVHIQDIHDSFVRTGALLLERNASLQPPADRQEMYTRFTETNDWAEGEIRASLGSIYPDVGWSDAELDFGKQKQPESQGAYWVLDAVDSVMHLHQGMSLWSMSLCLIEDGESVFSAVYEPYRREFFHAVRGGGAFLNGTPIRVSGKSSLSEAILATAPPAVQEPDPAVTEAAARSYGKLLPEAFLIRMIGSVALQLAYVASGRMDAYWEYGDSLYNWAAGALLVAEAGGSLSDTAGEPFTWGCRGIIAGPEPLREGIRELLSP